MVYHFFAACYRLGKPLRLLDGKGRSLGVKSGFLRRKSLPKPPKRRRPGFAFLAPKERFQNFSAHFPSGLRRHHVHLRGQRAANPRQSFPREALFPRGKRKQRLRPRRRRGAAAKPDEGEVGTAVTLADDHHYAFRFRKVDHKGLGFDLATIPEISEKGNITSL
jgi:hypothetical protein